MNTVLARLLGRQPSAPTPLPDPIALPSFRRSGAGEVGSSEDLSRILALPKRPVPTSEEKARLIQKWNERLALPAGPCRCKGLYRRACCSSLREVQAWALEEISVVEGLLGPIGVGHGKTLLDLLAPMAMPNCKTALLLLPPQLKKQLLDSDWSFYGQHWRLPNLVGGAWFYPDRPRLHVVAFSELSGSKSSDLLTRINPDLIIVDEAHSVRNRTAARTKRFLRYLGEHPSTRLLAWSGTLTSRSIKDYAHLSQHGLGAGSPTPAFWPTVEEWSAALDPKPTFALEPGALRAFGSDVHKGYRERLNATPGVVASADDAACEASLVINERPLKLPPDVRTHYEKVEKTWTRPDGEELVDAMSKARVLRELSCGFYYRWRWPRKEPVPVIERWLNARKLWHKEIRERLKQGGVHMDSPLLLAKAAIRWFDGYVTHDESGNRIEVPPRTRKGPMPTWASETWTEWKEVRDSAKPATEAIWLSDFAVQNAAEWLAESPGIAWYESDAFGRKLADAAGALFAGPGDAGAEVILDTRGQERVVASIRAHGTGKNLQHFSRNLVCQPPTDGATWEQLVGRTHRPGQLEDEVSVEVWRHTPTMKEAVEGARLLAGYIEGTFGAKQKLVSRASWGF